MPPKKAPAKRVSNVIFLPTTEDAFDTLIETLVKKYKLPNADHAAAVVANRIQHLPPDQATSTLEYLGHCVLKNIAYQVAQAKGQMINHRAQIDQLTAALTANPLDQQAMDALEKAALEGSEYARLALETLEPKSNLSIVKNLAEDTAPLAKSSRESS